MLASDHQAGRTLPLILVLVYGIYLLIYCICTEAETKTSGGVQMKREPDDVTPELRRAFNGDVAHYRRQLAGSRNNDVITFSTHTSSSVNARVPVTAFSQSGITDNLVHGT